MNLTHSSRLAWAAALLLLVAFSRLLWVYPSDIIQDEATSILRSFGNFSEIIAWESLDWPPLFNLLLGSWRMLMGEHPAVLRLLPVLLFLPGAAFTYRLGRRMFGHERAGWGAMAAYSALGYSVFLSTFLRGYAVTIALFPALLLLTIRYFDRPSIRRAALLGVVMAAMMYATYTAVFAVATAGVYSLIVYGRAVWRWWLPGFIAAGLLLPELLVKMGFFRQRVGQADLMSGYLPELLEGVTLIYDQYAGQAGLIWLGLFVLAAVLLIFRQRSRLKTLWLFGWVLLAPVVVYGLVFLSIWLIFTPRYGWWGLLGIALMIGAGLAYLPGRIWTGSMALMLALMFVPLPMRDYRGGYLPYEEMMDWLREKALPGDVLVVDPNFCIDPCGRGEAWLYYTGYYLKDSVQVVSQPGDHARVWYLKEDSGEDEAMREQVEEGRVGGIFYGPQRLLVRLYEAPPDRQGILFENGLRFHGFQVIEGDRVIAPPYDIREQAAVRLRLWWSVDRPLDQEYSINVVLIPDRTGEVIAQADHPPQPVHLTPNDFTPLPATMLDWQTGQYYVEERSLELPPLMTWYESALYLVVYQWWDGVRVPAPETNADGILPLADVLVLGW